MNREEILKDEPIMRIALAFYNFIRNNSNFNNRIENTIVNRYRNMSDYDFEFEKKLYSFYYQYVDQFNIRCCVKEYDTFYECAKSYEYIVFDYNINDGNIVKLHRNGLVTLDK